VARRGFRHRAVAAAAHPLFLGMKKEGTKFMGVR
jgi:hypothetical protein